MSKNRWMLVVVGVFTCMIDRPTLAAVSWTATPEASPITIPELFGHNFYSHASTSIESSGVVGSQLATAPSSYDLRNVSGVNYVTSVKNQGSYGSCWAFATFGAMESDILRAGGSTYDFSENNLKNRNGFDASSLGPGYGGNSWMSTAYLARLDGPGLETADPYHDYNDSATAPTTIPRQRFLRAVNYFDTSAEIKNALMAKGALYTSMYYDSSGFRSSDNTYYYSTGTTTNHDVTLVGWNDSKSTTGGTGAWLIKNSWGSSWGDSGYFWVSYNDPQACSYAASLETDAADKAKTAYCHDTHGCVGDLNTPYACEVYTTTAAEKLTSVGFYTGTSEGADNVQYQIKIYSSWNSSTNKPSGLLQTVSGTATNWGYHVVDLAAAISLPANDDFVVCLYLNGSETYMQAVDYAYSGYSSTSTASAGESYYSFDGTNWGDLTTAWNSTANFCINVYAVPEPAAWALLAAAATALLAWRRRAKESR